MRERDGKGKRADSAKNKRERKGVEREFVKMEKRGMRQTMSRENERLR